MVGMKIRLDEEKIRAAGQYDIKKLYASIDELAARNQLKKQAEGEYIKGGAHGFALVGRTYLTLKKTPWFMENVEEWKLNVDGSIEDLTVPSPRELKTARAVRES